MSAESLNSQQEVRYGVGHKKALELEHLYQREEINAFPSKRFTTEASTRINMEHPRLHAHTVCVPQIDTEALYL